VDQLPRQLENELMGRLEEVRRLQEIGDAIKCLVIDKDCAKQRLFGLDVVRG
jgi:hypothetical protein